MRNLSFHAYTLWIHAATQQVIDHRSLGQSIGSPAEKFVALLWVNELLNLADLVFSVFLNNGADQHTVLFVLVTVGGMGHG